MRRILAKIPYFSYFGTILATATLRQSSITFAGTAINGALGAVFYILAARFLGPASFGLMSVAITALTLTADVGDLGTDTGLVNFVARNIDKNKKKAHKFLKLGLEIKIVVSLLVLVLGYLLAPFLATKVFGKPDLTSVLKIAFVGVGTFLFFSYTTHVLQAVQKFWSWSVVQVATNALRVILIVAFLYLGYLSLENAMWLYILMPGIGFVLGMIVIGTGFLKVKKETSIAKEFFKYNKWVAAFVLVAAIGARLDTFISARLLSPTELGIYSAANQMVKIVPQIVAALGTVIAPKMASMESITELVKYIKKTQIMVLGMALLGMLTIPVVIWFIPHVFGQEYIASSPLFVVLFFAMLVFLISVPIHMSVFYYFSKPVVFFWLSLVHMLLIAGMGWYMIGTYGPMGAAITVLAGQILNFIVPLYWVLVQIKKQR